MEIVVAHSNVDFDSLAAQFAVTKLYPGVRMVPGHQLSSNIRAFLSLYRNVLPVVDLQYVDLQKITHVYLVDCQQLDRLEDLVQQLIGPPGNCSYTVFDHHHVVDGGLSRGAREDSMVKPAGAATSLLVEQMIERGIELTPFEATLLAIGIYEDSGCLTYSGTTELDARCVAYLLSSGADLEQVSNFINPKLNDEQMDLFQRLVRNTRSQKLSGCKVLISHCRQERYVEGLAVITRRLMEMFSADAAVAVAYMRDRVHVVGRSDTAAIDVRRIAIEFGGDGHRGAAAAVAKDMTLAEVVQRVDELLKEKVVPEPLAREIMTTPVRTIKMETSMDEASRIMLRYGQDGLVVVDGSGVQGVVSRRDVDKASHHKLSHAPVSGFMSRPVITVREDTPLSEIQHLMVNQDIGRLPVVNNSGELVGLVTRQDVLHTLYGASQQEEGKNGRLAANLKTWRLDSELASLDAANQWLFKEVGATAAGLGMTAYAVGGCVRDLILSRANFDLDFVVEGNAIDLANALDRAYPGRFALAAKHDRFQTARLTYRCQEMREVDLSTARTEFYEFPAALPTVEPSGLEQDLFRRDFTINALAVCVNPGRYGEVVDYFAGHQDMDDKLVRILHQFSFVEDPTRIVRGVRFAVRLGFALEPESKKAAEEAIRMGAFDNLGGSRLKEELKLLLELPQRLEALHMLNDLAGSLTLLAAGLVFDHPRHVRIRRAERLLRRYPVDHAWIIYLGILVAPLSESELAELLGRLYLANDEKDWISGGLKLLDLYSEFNQLPERSRIYEQLHGIPDQALAIAACLSSPGSVLRRSIRLYLEELRNVRVSLTGSDLLRAGFPQGPAIKEALSRLQAARLDGKVADAEQEFSVLRSWYPDYCKVHPG